jgi:hypothetical protein
MTTPPSQELAARIAQRVIDNHALRHPRKPLTNDQFLALQAFCRGIPSEATIVKVMERRDGKSYLFQEIAGAILQEWPRDDPVHVYVFTTSARRATNWKSTLRRMFTEDVVNKIKIKYIDISWRRDEFMLGRLAGRQIFLLDEVVAYVPDLLTELCVRYPHSIAMALFTPNESSDDIVTSLAVSEPPPTTACSVALPPV